MRELATNEILSLSKLLQMETNALAMTRTGIAVIEDDQLRSIMKTGVSAAEARIKGINQFIFENNIVEQEVKQ